MRPRRELCPCWILLLAAGVIAGLPTSALAGSRLVVALDETVDGAPANGSELEIALMERLRGDDRWIFVDAEQSRAVRRAAAGKPLLQADARALVTSLTADVLVVGQVELTKGDSGPFKSVVLYEATAQIKMIAVDSAEVINAFRVSAVQRHFRERAARSKAASDLAAAIADELQPPGPKRFQLDVALEPGTTPDDVDDIARCMREVAAVDDVQIRHFDAKTLLLDMRASATPPEVARALSQANQQQACGLSVVAYSSRRVRLRHSTSLSLNLVPTEFTPGGPKKGQRRWTGWMGEALARGIGTELGQLSYLNLGAAGGLVSAKESERRTAGRLVLRGRYRIAGETAHVTAEIHAAYRRRLVLSEKASCPAEAIEGCIQAVGDGLRAKLMPALKARRADIPLQKTLPAAPPALLGVQKLDLDGIYPARLAHYHAVDPQTGRPVNPVGYVHVVNRSEAPIERVELSARIDGLSERSLTGPAVDVAPGATVKVPVFLRFDADALAARDENRSEVLELGFRFEQGDLTFPLNYEAGVMVYERNAVNWAQDQDSVAAFVSPNARSVTELVDAVQGALPNEKTHRLALPIALFESLADLQYRRDPDNPYRPDELDSVQFPAETLARGGGDCDDLAVVYASMLQAAGWSTMLVQTPGHVFVAVGTQIPPSNAVELTVDPNAVIIDQQTLWVPVETTQVGKPFLHAWRTAAEELRAAREANKPPRMIRVRDAWKRFPPVQIAAPTRQAKARKLPDVTRAVDVAVASLETARREKLTRLRASKEPEDLNRYGVLLAQSGDRGSAEAVFEQSRGLVERSPVLNNLGNLKLLDAHADAAYALYERAIRLDEENLPVRVNAILALHMLVKQRGSKDRYERAFVRNVLELHERDPAVVVALQARLPQVGKTGSADGVTSVEGLSDRIDGVLRAEGKATRPAPIVTASRPGDAGLARHVNWLY